MPFEITAIGGSGPYVLAFEPANEWDGWVSGNFGNQKIRWPVHLCEEDEQGRYIAGMTSKLADERYGEFWFVIRYSATRPIIEFWGDQVLVRTDPISKIHSRPQ